jgi:peptidoglycan hydrolase-like protein with peptidoglycan-binding domain
VRVSRVRGKHCRPLRTLIVRRAATPVLAAFLAAGLVVAGGADAASARTALKSPVAPKAAPAVVEGYSSYLPQVSCDPVAKPGIVAVRAMLLAAYGGRDLGMTRACTIGGTSEHKEGRAWDWGLSAAKPAEMAVSNDFLTWLLAKGPGTSGRAYNARRLGVMYVIWNGKIWASYRAAEGWRAYTGGESHSDHIHISLSWNGAMKRTSWWTGKAAAPDYGPCPTIEGELAAKYSAPRATPCPAPTPISSLSGTPLLQLESTGPYVKQLQRRLSVIPVSGYFGPLTDAALRKFQKSHGLSVTGKTDVRTWTALRAGVTPPAPPAPTSGTVSPKYLSRLSYTVVTGDSLARIATYWRSSVSAIKAANRLKSDTIRPGKVLSVPVKSALTRYWHVRLRKGSDNGAVKVLQTAMRMPKKYRTGYFGDITAGYVNALKTRYGWKPNGLVGRRVWITLGA